MIGSARPLLRRNMPQIVAVNAKVIAPNDRPNGYPNAKRNARTCSYSSVKLQGLFLPKKLRVGRMVFGSRADEKEDARGSREGHAAGNQECRAVGKAIDGKPHGDGEESSDETGDEAAEAGNGGDDVLGEEVGRKSESYGGPGG